MAMTVPMSPATKGGSSLDYVAKPPPPPPGFVQQHKASYAEYNGPATRRSSAPPGHDDHYQALNGTLLLLLLRAAAAVAAFVAVALVASWRHGDWMEFGRYPEYRYLLGASAAACVYSAAQALRNFRRMRAGGDETGGLADFAGDQVVAYLLMTASSAALPITLRMRSAVINVFTDAMVAAISLGFIAFAALAFAAMLSGFRISAAAAAQQRPYY